MRTRRHIHLVAAAAVALTACSSSGNDQPNLPTRSPAAAPEAALAYASCMREHDVESFPDPEFDEAGQPNFPDVDVSDPDLDAASAACAGLLDSAPAFDAVDQEQVSRTQQRLLDYAQCMRDHGVDVPDPVFGDSPDDGVGDDDPQQSGELPPEFFEADEACRSFLPGPGDEETSAP